MSKRIHKVMCNIIGTLVVLGVGICLIQIIPPIKTTNPDTNPFLRQKEERPLVIAHAGSEEMFPTNTFLAFSESYNMGVDMFETDTHITKDGILLAHHDDTINRVSNGSGYVKDYTYQELLKYNFAYNFQGADNTYLYRNNPQPVCTIEDLFKSFPDVLYSIDIKAKGEEGIKAGEALAKLIKQYNMEDKVLVASFHDDVLDAFKKAYAETIMTTSGYSETTKMIIHTLLGTGLFYHGNDEVLQIPTSEHGIDLTSKKIINSAHRRGMGILYWSINDKEEMRRLITNGADGITTDRPDIMLELLEEMGFE